MATLQQLKDNFGRTWENVSEGWRHLVERAGGALTRFNPVHRSGDKQADRTSALSRHGARWGMLAAEVFDDDKQVCIELEAPGMEAGDFDIQVHGDVLVISGEKRYQQTRKEGRYHLVERAYGRFERAIPLPVPVDHSRAQASYRRGLLRITLPKQPSRQRRRIDVAGA